MAHECPECGMKCHCGGDIDDIVFHDTPEEAMCSHCDYEDVDDDSWFNETRRPPEQPDQIGVTVE